MSPRVNTSVTSLYLCGAGFYEVDHPGDLVVLDQTVPALRFSLREAVDHLLDLSPVDVSEYRVDEQVHHLFRVFFVFLQ